VVNSCYIRIKLSHNMSEIKGKSIIIVLDSLELGGAERQVVLFAKYLIHELGARVQVWGFHSPSRTTELCAEHGIPWRIVPRPLSGGRIQGLKSLIRFALTLRCARPDVILPYTMFPNVVCGLVWRWTGARLCVWNQRDVGVDRMGRKGERCAVRQTPWFISNSQHGADFLVQVLGVKRNRIRVIHNGIELPEPELDRAEWRSQLGVDDDCFIACMVANLSIYKDHITLLKAWRKVVDRLTAVGRHAVLLLAGRFDNTQDLLKALAFDLELGKSIRFLGEVKDVAGLLGAADLGVFSSRNEGCPNGVLECMAARLPVVGTDISGIREAVGLEEYQFLAPPGDAETLADRLLELALNFELRAKHAALNRERIEMEFNPRRMCEETVELISSSLLI
jgi:glycosyltransferase involved in cell wall biosynthesis